MITKEQLVSNGLPKHIAIIMDGNGRWARKKGNPRVFGHKNGVVAVRETVESCAELGVEYLTMYAFSTENWSRPRTEVDALMSLLLTTINKETKTLLQNNVSLLAIGDIDSLPKKVGKQLQEAIDKTKNNTGLKLVLALSYSSRWEIMTAVKHLVDKANKQEITADDISTELIADHLTTKNIPDPELLIRTSGEARISNFLLWQIAYSELYFTETLWPDFRKEHLYAAIADYQCRERRFGKTSDQITVSENANSKDQNA